MLVCHIQYISTILERTLKNKTLDFNILYIVLTSCFVKKFVQNSIIRMHGEIGFKNFTLFVS